MIPRGSAGLKKKNKDDGTTPVWLETNLRFRAADPDFKNCQVQMQRFARLCCIDTVGHVYVSKYKANPLQFRGDFYGGQDTAQNQCPPQRERSIISRKPKSASYFIPGRSKIRMKVRFFLTSVRSPVRFGVRELTLPCLDPID